MPGEWLYHNTNYYLLFYASYYQARWGVGTLLLPAAHTNRLNVGHQVVYFWPMNQDVQCVETYSMYVCTMYMVQKFNAYIYVVFENYA